MKIQFFLKVFNFSSGNDVISAMKFGRFGREDSALVMVTSNGSLTVKILKRTAHFEKLETASAPHLSKVMQFYIIFLLSIILQMRLGAMILP